MQELKFEELTTRQKLGMTFTAMLYGGSRPQEDDDFVLDLIKNHSLGAVWIQEGLENAEAYMSMVKAAADYPILIITDCERGIADYRVGKHNAIGCTGKEKYAYAFGKTVGVTARKMGYNVVCNPVVDMTDGGPRSLGVDKDKVTALAIAEVQGMHDGGVLSVCKHYPGGSTDDGVDSHMTESASGDTKEELLDYSLHPYIKLNEKGMLDGIMSQHKRFYNIDPEYPATLSKTMLDIIREQNFNGFIITDALCMMGIRARFGDVASKGLAINAGIDLLLPYFQGNQEQFRQYCEAYDQGLVSDDMLDAAVKRILEAQHKVMLLPKDTELTEKDLDTFNRINKDGTYTKIDAEIPTTISRNGNHYFAVLINQDTDMNNITVDTFSNGWHQPGRIAGKIKELFPNATVQMIRQYPSQSEMWAVLSKSLNCDELVFITFSEQVAATGPEHLTRRVESLISSLQITNRVSTLIHHGNPHVLENLPHIPRCIFGGHSAQSIDTSLEVLAGEYPANGVPTYTFTLK